MWYNICCIRENQTCMWTEAYIMALSLSKRRNSHGCSTINCCNSVCRLYVSSHQDFTGEIFIFCPNYLKGAQVMCVISMFSVCQGEDCGTSPGQRLTDQEACQTQRETQWDALTTFNPRDGLCFSTISHMKHHELKANSLIFGYSNGKEH